MHRISDVLCALEKRVPILGICPRLEIVEGNVGELTAAAALGEPAIGFPLERFPWAEAMIAYARALGDARTGNIAGADAEIQRLQSLEAKLKGNDNYWANQVEVQRLVGQNSSFWLPHSSKRW
jgi:hypothetical protein